MIVLKFGGSSVKNADRMRAVGQIVRDGLPRRPLVVLSAIGGVTDLLYQLAEGASVSDWDMAPLIDRHRQVCADLGLSMNLSTRYSPNWKNWPAASR